MERKNNNNARVHKRKRERESFIYKKKERERERELYIILDVKNLRYDNQPLDSLVEITITIGWVVQSWIFYAIVLYTM